MTLQPTSGKAWRERQQAGVLMLLPSGLIARVRGVQPEVIIKAGRVHDTLTPVIQAIMDGRQEDWQAQTIADLDAAEDFTRLVCESALLEPRIVGDPTADDEMAYSDLDYVDRVYLLGTVLQPLKQLELFRLQQTSTVEPVDAPKRNRKGRQRPAANRAVGGADDGA